MNEDPKFIHVNGIKASEVTGKPHRMVINIADIVSVEEINYQYAANDDEIVWGAGSDITIRNGSAVEVKEPFDVINALIQLKLVDGDWQKMFEPYKKILIGWWVELGIPDEYEDALKGMEKGTE